jgi:hypothetical protein
MWQTKGLSLIWALHALLILLLKNNRILNHDFRCFLPIEVTMADYFTQFHHFSLFVSSSMPHYFLPHSFPKPLSFNSLMSFISKFHMFTHDHFNNFKFSEMEDDVNFRILVHLFLSSGICQNDGRDHSLFNAFCRCQYFHN